MKKNKELSIIIPVYNSEKYLAECLDSILKNQKLDRTEVILVNDGSTDGSERICEEYISRYNNLFRYIKTKNSGLSEARNNGLSMASGKYVWFVDSDDMVSADAISNILNQKSEHDITVMGYVLLCDNKKEEARQDCVEDPVCKYLINTPLAQIRILRKNFLERISFRFEKGKYYEDSGSMYGLVKHTEDIVYIDKAFYIYRKHAGSITMDGDILSKTEDRFWATKRILDDVPDKYLDERNFQAIKTLGLFYSFDILNLVKGKARKSELKKVDEFLTTNIPNYWNNKYLKRHNNTMRAYRLFLRLLHLRMFKLCGLVSVLRKRMIS